MRAATSMMLELVAEFGIAPNSPRLQRGANLSQLFSLKMVPPRGNAPRSIDYRSMALLLSYRGKKIAREGYAPSTPGCRPGALLLRQRAESLLPSAGPPHPDSHRIGPD